MRGASTSSTAYEQYDEQIYMQSTQLLSADSLKYFDVYYT